MRLILLVARRVVEECLGAREILIAALLFGLGCLLARSSDGPDAASAFAAAVRGIVQLPVDPFTAFISLTPTLGAPTTETTDTTPTLTWNAIAGATHYYLWVNNLATGQVIDEQNLTGTSFTAAALPVGRYRAWIQAHNALGQASAWSPADDFRVVSLLTAEAAAVNGEMAVAVIGLLCSEPGGRP